MSKEMTYEKAIKRLEEIVELLEKNDATLEESMKLFEEGVKLTAYCNEQLTLAEQKVTELTKNDD